MLRALTIAAVVVAMASGCSNWMANNDFRLSARTMDLGSLPAGSGFGLLSSPRGQSLAFGGKGVHGFLGFVPEEASVDMRNLVTAGLNEVGLSCDVQTLLGSKYPQAQNASTDLPASNFCEWALAGYSTAAEVRESLLNGTVHVHGDLIVNDKENPQHFVVRDVHGESAIIEFMDGKTNVYQDLNDGGKTGFGVMTNEPAFPWQVENVRHYLWKKSLARPATTMPGTWYPDERFLRIHLVKSGMKKPDSYQEAVMQVVHTLNTVTVPMGEQMGTDSGAGEGEGDHTLWGVVYDHLTNTLYFRTKANQNLQRVRLSAVDLTEGAKRTFLPVTRNFLPWFVDAISPVPTRLEH